MGADISSWGTHAPLAAVEPLVSHHPPALAVVLGQPSGTRPPRALQQRHQDDRQDDEDDAASRAGQKDVS
jgi:hypothetical protein